MPAAVSSDMRSIAHLGQLIEIDTELAPGGKRLADPGGMAHRQEIIEELDLLWPAPVAPTRKRAALP